MPNSRVAIIMLVNALILALWQVAVNKPLCLSHEQREIIVNKTDNLKASAIDSSTSSNPPLKAILHVGPHKTGTSTVQGFLYSNRDALMKDGFILPQFTGTHRASKNVATMASCISGRGSSLNCTDIVERQMIEFLDNARRTQKNVLFSAEAFSREEVDWERLIGLLHGFDIEVVLVYRRFYDYLRSMYTQANKLVRRRYRESGMKGVLATPTIPEFFTPATFQMYSRQHSVQLYQRARNYTMCSTAASQSGGREGCSNNNHVRVYNYHRSGDFLPQFICQMDSMLPSTCQRARKQNSDKVVNKGSSLDADFVLARAHEQGIFNYENIIRGRRHNSFRKEVDAFIQSHSANAKEDPFFYSCLNEMQRSQIVSVSQELEDSLLQFTAGTTDAAGMKELTDLTVGFQNSKHKFCTLNATNFLTKYGDAFRSILLAA